VQAGSEEVSASVPDAISAVLGIAGDFFSRFLIAFTGGHQSGHRDP
jgi:hypothetical protein